MGVIAKDGSAIVPTLLTDDKALQQQFGVQVEAKAYPSVTAVWTAFAAGEFDFLIGGPAGFVGLVEKGVPIHLMATYSISSAQIFGAGKRIESAADLRGKRVTAVVAGLWKLTEAQIKAKWGLAPGAGYELIPVPNLMAGVTQVLAGTADYAMGWEPDATRVRQTYPTLKLALSSEDLRPAGEPSIIQVIGSKNSITADVQKKAADALAAMSDKVTKDPVAAEAKFASMTGAEKGAFAEAVKTGRYQLTVRLLNAPDKALLKADILKTMPPNAVVPPKLLDRS
ncbi:ABC transporter, substrate-binding protein, aliphatic sulfonates family (plasmid) [Variovorax sp. SRS16]|nr:ABC transporter, substrate-binding protein, aliphatic sulfonates family [Variovorax sp. SRS16]